MDKNYINDRTIFSSIVGSKAYGTDTPESDTDVRGVAVMDNLKYYFGFLDKFEQFEDKINDKVIYDIRKFFNLAADANPNILDLLFVDEKFWIKSSPVWENIIDNRDKFLSKNVRFRYVGYSFAQLKRIRTARSWLLNPPKKKPERSDFGLPEEKVLLKSDTGAFQWVMSNLLQNTIEYLNLSDATKAELKNANWVGLVQRKGVPDHCWDETQKICGASDEWMDAMKREQGYNNAKRHFDSYTQWKNSRNKKRAILEEKFGYDCYSDDTEFLTSDGWKLFDNINEIDELATIKLIPNTNNKIEKTILEYQKPIEKFDGHFNGNMYNFYGNHYDVLVTPNHRMIYQKKERKSEKTFDWKLDTASSVPDTFNFIRTIIPKNTNYSNKNIFDDIKISPIAFLRLAGWFVSDGSLSMRNNNPKDIRISQKKGGKLHWNISRFAGQYNKFSSLYQYERKPNGYNPNKIVECVLSVRDKNIVNKIYNDFTDKRGNKKLPRWIFGLSKRLMEECLDAMILGDGTKSRPDHSMIYYSKDKQLANDTQELAFMCGFETSLYGPYNGNGIKMYQVHINKTRDQTKTFVRNNNLRKINVKNQRIVCFSVSNGTLITRRNGHIGIHGNCKHASHLVRLMRMGKEILSEGKVLVFRPDADELKDIRNGSWPYDKIEEYAYSMEKEIISLMDSSPLPKEPDRKMLNNLCIEIIAKYTNG